MNPVNAASMTRDARRGGYAIGAFNLLDFPTMRGIVEGAQRSRAPVILQASVRTVEYWSPAVLAGWYRLLIRDADIPVALHLDHCPRMELIRICIDEGWTSVMIDASSLPLEANISATAAVIELARPAGVSVEAELGTIGGSEDGAGSGAGRASPVDAARFIARAAVDIFAPAVGNEHGLSRAVPEIDVALLESISGIAGVPLALHGGTGLPADLVRRCIAAGCAKVNVSTALKLLWRAQLEAAATAAPADRTPVGLAAGVVPAIAEFVREQISVFGSCGTAVPAKPAG